MKKITILLVAFIVSSCGSFIDNYPNFKKSSANIKSLDILIDVGFLEDIEGDEDRYNVSEHIDFIQNDLEKKVKKTLNSKGYKVNNIYKSVGLSLNNKVDKNIKTYIDSSLVNQKDEFNNLIKKLVESNSDVKKIENSKFLNNISSADRFLIISYYGKDINDGRSFASALLTGALSIALTGGTYVYSSYPVDYMYGGFYIVNYKNNNISLSKKLQKKGFEPSFINIKKLILDELNNIPNKY